MVGVVVGAGGARLLVSARRTSWSSEAGERLAVLVLPLLTYLTAVALGGNGFVAAFVAGIAAGTVGREEVAEERLQLTNDVGTLLSSAVWFVFGSLIPDVIAHGISWNVLLYAVLSLTLIRMVPVALALVRSGLGTRDVLFLGWIGPRGLASILFGLIAIEELHAHGLTAAADSVAAGDRGDREPERAAARVDRRGHRGALAGRPDTSATGQRLTRPGAATLAAPTRKGGSDPSPFEHGGPAPSPTVTGRNIVARGEREMSSVSGSNVDVGAGDTDLAAPPPYAREATDVATALGSDSSMGLTGAEAAARLARYGPNQITAEKPPSILAVALTQLRDPMNIMLIAVTVVSFVIGQVSTGVIVGLLILLNVVLGSRQELKARASVDALSNLQVPQAKVVRGGALVLVPAVDVVPG